jgi:methionine-rich copper-binding protein CopC
MFEHMQIYKCNTAHKQKTEQHVAEQSFIKEIVEEIKKLLKFNEKENTTYQNLWDIAKAVLRGKYSYECLHQKHRNLKKKKT